MVQLSLPKNSEIKKGKYFKDKTGSKNLRKVNIYRWDPSTDEGPRIDTYEVDMDNCPSKVLDILNKIKNEIDSTITYRSCLLYTSPSPRDISGSRMPSSA